MSFLNKDDYNGVQYKKATIMKAERIKSELLNQLGELRQLYLQLEHLEQCLTSFLLCIENVEKHNDSPHETEADSAHHRRTSRLELIDGLCQILKFTKRPMTVNELVPIFTRNYAHCIPVQILDIRKYCIDLIRRGCKMGLITMSENEEQQKLYGVQ